MMVRVGFLTRDAYKDAIAQYGKAVIPVSPGRGDHVAGFLDMRMQEYTDALQRFPGLIV